MTPKPLIALEIHDASLWHQEYVFPAIEAMERWGYNALVLHQNDLLDACTQLGLTANYGVADLRLKKVRHNTAWLNRLAARLTQMDARLFLEVKEPSFHDYARELYPDLLGPDGQPDPTRPAWQGFCRDKVADLLRRVPDLDGLILTLASPESRVSLPDFEATHGSTLDRTAWFRDLIAAFHTPLEEAGKALYIRDFSYTTDLQSDVLSAVARFGGAVGSSVKVTAHDYFPDYPENPVARTAPAPMLLEFEGFGEHMGWGVIPNCRVDEFCTRMRGYRERGAAGLLMRISWEAIKGVSALDSLSAVNVFVLPRLVQGDVPASDLVLAWLKESFGLTGDIAAKADALLRESWQIPAATYWHGKVFPRHSCLPSTWQEGWLSMSSDGMGRRDRDLSIQPEDPRITEGARAALFAQKEAATELARDLAARAAALRPALPDRLALLWDAFRWLPVFARQFELATKATFFMAKNQPAQAQPLRAALLGLAVEVEDQLAAAPDLPHHARVLLDPDQIRLFAASLDAD